MFALRPALINNCGLATSALRTAGSSVSSSSTASTSARLFQAARFSSASSSSSSSSQVSALRLASSSGKLVSNSSASPAKSFFTSFQPATHARPVSSALGLRGASGNAGFNLTARRLINTQAGPEGQTVIRGATLSETFSRPENRRSLLMNVGLIAGTALAATLFFNRETREAPLDAFSKEYLNSAFRYLAGGLTMTGITAVALHQSGFAYRLMAMNPWVVMIGGLAVSIGGMIGAQTFEPGSPAKYMSWFLFNAAQGAVLSPLFFFNPALLARAGLYTAGVVGSLCYVGATAKDGQFLYLGGPLLAGVTVVALSGLSPLVLPATAIRTLAAAEAISLYGGLAVFSGFLLYDTQKILHHAKMAQRGLIRPDPLRESIGLELDVINIFIRMVQILAMQNGGNRRK
ncbi:hypothetical protein OC846_000648 [Tilletia horrida]|uniref:Growth hormone-inducible transmembrane protein n=1 Tax=Tilletia horrida TaxID=155126 RepID=A0AAN6GUI4_9BASI|nr:hypothetical protein OC846_000648 [Tilletia horrida]KAK0569774.1 hypothetical protein OC861_000611 [Tilletia horrida]